MKKLLKLNRETLKALTAKETVIVAGGTAQLSEPDQGRASAYDPASSAV